MQPQLIIDIIGWVGAITLLLAYGSVSRGMVQGTSFGYQLANAIGSGGLLLNSTYHHAFPSTFVNIVWVGIAIVTMVKYRGRSKPAGENITSD
jgi:hypothetical protein